MIAESKPQEKEIMVNLVMTLLLVAILAKSKYFRIGCCIVLAAWFVLTLFGFSEWVMYWSV